MMIRNILVIFVVFLFGLIGYYFNSKNQEEKKSPFLSDQIIIETEPAPVLYPHVHDVGDSLYNPDHHLVVSSEIVTVEEDVWVTSIEVVVKNAPHAVHHHSLLYRLDVPSLSCPHYIGEELITIGADSPSYLKFPEPYGIFLKKGTPLFHTAMFHNPLPPIGPGKVYENVSAMIVLGVERKNSKRNRPLKYYKLFLDDTPCEEVFIEDLFAVPPHTEHFVKKGGEMDGVKNYARFVFPASGVIVWMDGHLHPWEGGEKLDVFINEEQIASFTPVRSSSEPWSWSTVLSSSDFLNLFPVQVQPGDEISITATYSNPHSVPIIGAMGILRGFFAIDEI